MTLLWVPYHLDEYLPDFRVPEGFTAETITVDLPDADAWTRMVTLHEVVAERVAGAVRAGERVTVVSSDCMVALGVAAGVQRAGVDPGIVWLDAHADLQTLETSESGYLGGIPLSILLGYRPELWAKRLGLRTFDEQDIVLAGARDIDPPEAEYLRTARVRRAEVGPTTVAPSSDRPVLLHLDTDVVDPRELAGQLFPTEGGVTQRDVVGALRAVAQSTTVPAVSIGCTSAPERVANDPTYRRFLSEVIGA